MSDRLRRTTQLILLTVILIAAPLVLFSLAYLAPSYSRDSLAPPTATPIVQPPTSSLDFQVKDILDRLPLGQITYNPPTEMTVGESEMIAVRISHNINEDLSRGLQGRGTPVTETIPVHTFMKVQLRGGDAKEEDFKITKMNDEEQAVTESSFTQWTWTVLPIKSGEQTLHLTITYVAKIGSFTATKGHPSVIKSINVKVNPIYSLREFIGNYWQWVLTSLAIPVVVWIKKIFLDKKGGQEDKTLGDKASSRKRRRR